MEKRLKDSLDKQLEVQQRASELEEKNAELVHELKDIDRLSKRAEEDKERDINVVRAELVEAKVRNLIFFPEMTDEFSGYRNQLAYNYNTILYTV